ncbi:MAG: SDR family NAD(P)-dependent oxidoreductase [Propioniciclava sp.]
MRLGPNTPRTVVISGVGSARGIGRAIAHRMAAEGWAVAGGDLDGTAATDLAAELSGEHQVPAFGGPLDVSDEASVAAFAQQLRDADLPPVGSVMPVAGIPSPESILDVTLPLWEKVFAVNSTGTFLLIQSFLPAMIDAGWGRIVTMSSVSAQQGGGVFSKTPYSAAKAAILGYTRSVARELGPHGITANAVSPGAVDTDIRAGNTDAEKEAALSASVPLGRQASVDDIASLFTFLASEHAGYITGTTININGGGYIA